MKEVLRRLEGAPGVHDAVILSFDGVVVASMRDGGDAERIAAFVSAMLISMERDAETLGFVPLKRMTVQAARGRLVVMPLAEFALVVVADRETDLSHALIEVEALAQGLLRRSRLDVQV